MGGRDEVWDRETMVSQLAKQIFLDFLEARSEPAEEIRHA